MNALLSPSASHTDLCLEGDLMIARAAELKTRLLGALIGPLAVDLSGVTAIDGAGLQLLVMLDREATRRGIPISWHGSSRAVRTAFDRLRVDSPSDLSAPAAAGGCA